MNTEIVNDWKQQIAKLNEVRAIVASVVYAKKLPKPLLFKRGKVIFSKQALKLIGKQDKDLSKMKQTN